MSSIGHRIKRLRYATNLSQRDLSEQGVSYAYISRIEAGAREPSIKALRKIAPKLGVTVAYLETGEDVVDVRLTAQDARDLFDLSQSLHEELHDQDDVEMLDRLCASIRDALPVCTMCGGHGFQAGAHTNGVESCPGCGGTGRALLAPELAAV